MDNLDRISCYTIIRHESIHNSEMALISVKHVTSLIFSASSKYIILYRKVKITKYFKLYNIQVEYNIHEFKKTTQIYIKLDILLYRYRRTCNIYFAALFHYHVFIIFMIKFLVYNYLIGHVYRKVSVTVEKLYNFKLDIYKGLALTT